MQYGRADYAERGGLYKEGRASGGRGGQKAGGDKSGSDGQLGKTAHGDGLVGKNRREGVQCTDDQRYDSHAVKKGCGRIFRRDGDRCSNYGSGLF